MAGGRALSEPALLRLPCYSTRHRLACCCCFLPTSTSANTVENALHADLPYLFLYRT